MIPYHVRHLMSSLTVEVLRDYMNTTFIETGTNMGHGVQVALDCGFETVVSIEEDPLLYGVVRRRYRDNRRVHLYCGDSAYMLRSELHRFRAPITFYLDAHSITSNPLLAELMAIKQSEMKGNTILIDDVRMFGTHDWHGLTLDSALTILNDIDTFDIIYRDTPNASNDLLVAVPR